MTTVLAVDGGNSKTDVAIVGIDGTVLASVRGAGSSPHHVGVGGAVDEIGSLFRQARALAGTAEPPAVAMLVLAGADQPHEEQALLGAAVREGWAERVVVLNDTYAVLRSGTDAATGVAVVCGAGINCVGRRADGETVRFAALGGLTGDWGGGQDVGAAALGAAVRAEDGRGQATVLADRIAEHFGLASATAVAQQAHAGQITIWALAELSPLVFAAAAGGDAVAGAVVDRLADEVADFVRAATARLRLGAEPFDVVLGGSILRAGWERLDRRIDERVASATPGARLLRAPVPALAGAALLALDQLGASAAAHARLRAGLATDPPRVTR